ncbi:SiaB family protein kinase [Flavobacteriales bacterium]|nr:SiaB family protein kinase [Flavobacteriales bacterium]
MMVGEKIIIEHKGEFTKEKIGSLLSSLKVILQDEVEVLITRKRLYNIAVECLENIVRHGAERPVGYNLFMIVEKAGTYYMTAGNILRLQEKEFLETLMNDISVMDMAALKKKHREVLFSGQLGERGGAGLGMYQIAIKSDNSIEYVIDAISEEIFLFQIEIKI